jgi:hypothetical protein
MDRVFWIFLWLIPTLSLNTIKLKLSIGFFCLACHNTLVSNHTLPRFDSNCAGGFVVFIPAYAAASAFVACCVATTHRISMKIATGGSTQKAVGGI